MTSKKSIVIMRAGLLALGLTTCAPAAFAIDPIKVGVMVATSPPGVSSPKSQTRDGLEIALKMINDAEGALGRPFELVYAEAREGDGARAAVEQLVTRDKVSAIIGEQDVAAALAVVEATHRLKVPYLTGTRSHAIGQKLYPEIYNLGISSSQIALAIAESMKGLGAKRVVAFTENSDSGIELADQAAHQLNRNELGIEYSFEGLDPAGKDFAPVLAPRKANSPDAIVQMLRPPAAYTLIRQMQQAGLAPSARTWLYDASGLIEDPGFWQNVGDAGPGMLVFGLYHPKMPLTDLGRKVAEAYRAKSQQEPSGALLQAADSLLLVAEAIRSGGSSEPEAVTKALESIKWTGTRGTISFSAERDDYKYHQWLGVPYVVFQITAVRQPIGETALLQQPGQPLEVSRIAKPK